MGGGRWKWVSAPVCIVALSLAAAVCSAAPTLVSHQGYLSDAGGNPVAGPVAMHFAIYDAVSNGAVQWSEDHPAVALDGGVYTVLLGSLTPLTGGVFAGDERWLEVTVNGEVLAPRQRIASVPYALRAEGVPTGAVTTLSIAPGAVTSDRIAAGAVGSDQIADGAVSAGKLAMSIPDGHSLDAADGSPVDALFVDAAGNVGIGTAAPGERLDVAGIVQAQGGVRFPDGTLQGTALQGSGSVSVSNEAWHAIGAAGFSGGTASYPSLALDGAVPYVAFRDGASASKATVMRYNGISWEAVGASGFSAGTAGYTSLAMAGTTPYVAFADGASGGRATVMRYNGTSWETVGAAGFSAGAASYTSLAMAGTTPYVAFSDGANAGKLTVMRYNGTSWETVGAAGFSPVAAGSVSFVVDSAGTPYAAYAHGGSMATVMRYNGTSWASIKELDEGGEGLSGVSMAVGPGNEIYLAYLNGTYEYIDVKKYSGSSWTNLGGPYGVWGASPAGNSSMAVGADGTPYAAFVDLSGGEASVIYRDGSVWKAAGDARFSEGAVAGIVLAVDAAGRPCAAYQDGAHGNRATLMRRESTLVVDRIAGDGSGLTNLPPETDPLFSASPAAGITAGQVPNWDAAFGWGNHAAAGYDITGDPWTGTGSVYTMSGNVGIGTSTPQDDLEIKGDLRLDNGAGGGTVMRFTEANVKKWALLYRPWAGSSLAFYDEVGVKYPLFLQPGTGHVGINATDPQSELDVNGDARVSGTLRPDGGIIAAGAVTVESTAGNVVITAGTTKITVAQSGAVTIESVGDVNLSAGGNLSLSGNSVSITSTAGTTISAGTAVDVDGAVITLN